VTYMLKHVRQTVVANLPAFGMCTPVAALATRQQRIPRPLAHTPCQPEIHHAPVPEAFTPHP
jgi:hypothetical protein